MIKVITVIVETVRKLGLNYEAQPLDTFSSLERMAKTQMIILINRNAWT